MEMYSAHVELSRQRMTSDQVDKIMDELEAYQGAVGQSPRGFVDAQFSLPAEHMAQACTTAVAVMEAAAAAAGIKAHAVAVEVMTEDEFLVREGWEKPEEISTGANEVIGSEEVAKILGVSRQRVMQLVAEGRLSTQPVGKRAHGFVRRDVEQLASSRKALTEIVTGR